MNKKLARLFMYTLLLSGAFLLRAQDISFRSIWMDEDRQAIYAWRGPLSLDVMKGAAQQKQPPLDYYLESIGIALFGFTEKGFRIHAVVAGAITCFIAFIFLYRRFNFQTALCGYLLFTFNPWLLRYSVEGRPYSSGVLFAVFLIIAYYYFIHSRSRRTFWGFALALTFMLYTIGFQSIVFVVCFAIASLFSSIIWLRQARLKAIGLAILALSVAAAAFFPFFSYLIASFSSPILEPISMWTIKLAALARNYTFSEYKAFFDLAYIARFLLVLAFIGFITSLWMQKLRKNIDSAGLEFRSTIWGIVFLFPIVCWFYWHFILSDWPFDAKYKLVFLPALFFAISLGLHDFFYSLHALFGNKLLHPASQETTPQLLAGRMRNILASAGCHLTPAGFHNAVWLVTYLCIFTVIGSYIVTSAGIARKLAPSKFCWRDLYAAIKPDVATYDIFLIENLQEKSYRPFYYGRHVYFEDYLNKVIMLPFDSDLLTPKIMRISNAYVPSQKIYLTFYFSDKYKDSIGRKENFIGSGFRYLDVAGLPTLVYSNPRRSLVQNLTTMLEYIFERIPEGETRQRIRWQLATLYLYGGDAKKAFFFVNQLRTFDKSGEYEKFIRSIYTKAIIEAQKKRIGK